MEYERGEGDDQGDQGGERGGGRGSRRKRVRRGGRRLRGCPGEEGNGSKTHKDRISAARDVEKDCPVRSAGAAPTSGASAKG